MGPLGLRGIWLESLVLSGALWVFSWAHGCFLLGSLGFLVLCGAFGALSGGSRVLSVRLRGSVGALWGSLDLSGALWCSLGALFGSGVLSLVLSGLPGGSKATPRRPLEWSNLLGPSWEPTRSQKGAQGVPKRVGIWSPEASWSLKIGLQRPLGAFLERLGLMDAFFFVERSRRPLGPLLDGSRAEKKSS